MADTDVTATTVDLLRHGHCEGGPILRGRTDSPLSPLGRRQMHGALGEQAGWTRVFTSPLQRCHDFAAEFAAVRGLPLAVLPGLREMDFGDWDGEPLALLQRREGSAAARFFSVGEPAPPGAESLECVRQRALSAWREVVREHRGDHILLVSHGGVIRLLLAALGNLSFAQSQFFAMPHATLSRLRLYHLHGHADRLELVLHRAEPAPC